MKTLILCGLMALTTVAGRAQLFTPESLGGAALGGLAGGIIGHNHHRQTAEGAAIGAGAGLLLGSLFHQARDHRHPSSNDSYSRGHNYRTYPPTRSYRHHGRPSSYRTYSGHGSTYRPNYAVGGTLLGGLAGGIIGHNHHRQTAEGVAIGAGAGLLLGGFAEHHARHHERAYRKKHVVYPPQPGRRLETAPPRRGPAEVTIINVNPVSRSGGAMGNANRLFGR